MIHVISSTPQQALEAERAVLGCVLLDNTAMDKIAELLDGRDFSLVAHELMWKGMKYLYQRNHPIDLITLTNMLQTYSRLEQVGGVPYITELVDSRFAISNVDYYAKIVRSRAYRKRAYEAGEKIIKIANEDEFENDDDFFTEVDKIASVIRPQTNGDMKHISEYRKGYFEYLAQQEDYIYTGFKQFDEWMGGYGRGWLIIKAGRPSVGKTAKVLQEIVGIGKQQVGEVLMWSQEMKANSLINRMLPCMTGINAGRIRRKQVDDLERKRLDKAYDELDKLPIHFYDAKNVTIEEVRATAKQMKRKYGRIAALVVDYLTIMRIVQAKGDTRSQAVGAVTRSAKQIALEMDCPFIMLAQLNREGAGEPKLEHLRDSGEIEQDADVVEFLWHNPDDTHQNGTVVQSTIAKGRDIGVNHFRYLFQKWLQHYEELPS